MDYDVGVRLDAIIARQDVAKQERLELRKKLDALVNALSEAEEEVRTEPVEPGQEQARPGMPKLGKKTPKGGKWEEA